MRDTGFEPVQALSHESLNLAHLTTLALPLTDIYQKGDIKSFINELICIKLKTVIIGWKHLFPFRTQKLSFLC